MADRRLLGAAAGLAMGIDKATTNLQNIMESSYKMRQVQQEIDLRKKSLENDITKSGAERDYNMRRLDMEGKKVEADIGLVDLKTKEFEWQKGEGERNLANVVKTIQTIQNFRSQQPTSMTDGLNMDSVKLGLSINDKGAASVKIKEPGQIEQYRNDLKAARDSVTSGDMSPDQTISILEDTYPEKFINPATRELLKIQMEPLVPKGGKKTTTQPNKQAQIDKARQVGYTDEQIQAYLGQ